MNAGDLSRRAWLGCLGLLLAVLIWEFLPTEPHAVRQAAVSAKLAVQTPARTRGPVPDYAAIVLARPLFSIHRRPAVEAARAVSGRAAGLPRLSGIVVAASYRRAIFDGDGKPLEGGVGDHVGPYAILSITPRQVTVTGPAGFQTLTLRFGPNQAAPPPAGPSILDRLRSQQFRPAPLPSSMALNRLLQQQQPRPPQAAPH